MKSNQFITLDQSISKCAWMYWVDNKPVAKGVILTGDLNAKTKKKGVKYLDGVDERISYVCLKVMEIIRENFKVSPRGFEEPFGDLPVVFEGLSFGSAGNATRDLAGLYYTMRYCLNSNMLSEYSKMHTYVPTSIKALARNSLPESEQVTTNPKTGKPLKVKMDKKLMVKACQQDMGVDFLEGYNYSTGLDDLADAYWLGRLYIDKELK